MNEENPTILITGADGMIGHGIWRHFSGEGQVKVVAALRSERFLPVFQVGDRGDDRCVVAGDLTVEGAVDALIAAVDPEVIINCAGLTKHRESGQKPALAIAANSLLPHVLASRCEDRGARLVHISSDCVFSGDRGAYLETDLPDASDLYGRSKALGEVSDSPNTVTIRTSTIGFELDSRMGLLEWFLGQTQSCRGFKNAFFSGLTTTSLASVLLRHVCFRTDLTGLVHVSGPRISKFELLEKITECFGKSIHLEPDEKFRIDRSIEGEKFSKMTGFIPESWESMLSDLARERHA